MNRPVLVVILLLSAVVAFAQTESARVSGRVTDQTGAVIVGVQCKITNIETNVSATIATNSDGIYVFPNLHPATYRLIIQKNGFHTVVKPDLTLQVQDAINENFTLAVGSTSESISVTGGAPVLDTESASVSTVVDDQFVQNMPLNGRSFQSLIALVPGVVFTSANATSPGQFSVNGQRTNDNYFMVDGVSANFGSGAAYSMGSTISGSSPGWTNAGGTSGLVSVDAMQEFRIQTSTYAPEFGRSPGGQVSIVTKSGTNRFHGTAYDYLRNDVFDARNWFNTVPNPQPALRQNDFGGTVGGPIWKDKTFFFFSYEGLRLRQPTTQIGTFLTAAARANVAPVWQPWVNADPIPSPTAPPIDPTCDNITNPCQANITMSSSLPSTLNATSLRIDHNLSSRITLFARYNYAPSSSVGDGSSENFSKNFSNVETATVGATFLLSTNKSNDLRVNSSRNVGKKTQYDVNFYGGVAVPNSVLFPAGFSPANTQIYAGDANYTFSFGPRVGSFSDNVQRQINVVDTFSWTKGKHQLKFGFDWRRLKPSPSFTPNSIGLYPSYTDLVNGNLSYCYCATGGANTIILKNYSTFAQDTWKAMNRLTLTYGLRWEVNPAPTPATSQPIYVMQGVFDSNPLGLAPAGTPLWHTKYANFAPRIGAAYQLTPKTVVRGGFGLFHELGVPSSLANSLSDSFPNSRAWYSANNIPFSYSDPTIFKGPPFTLTPTSTVFGSSAIDPNLKVPVIYQWSAAVQRELGKSQSLTVSYVASKGQNLIRSDEVLPPNSFFYAVSANHNADWSRYNSLQVQFQRRMSHGLQAMLSYTLSKSTDTASNESSAILVAAVSDLPNVAINQGNSDFDVRNNFTAAVSYELPAPVSGKVGHALLKGWAVDSIVLARGGTPISINSFAGSINGVSQSLRPDLVPGQPIWINDKTQPGGKYLNINAFTNPPAGRQGNLQRNSLRNFGMDETDLALRRRFDITERVKLDFRAEYFNLFNHPMFAIGPDDVYTFFGNFGHASETLNQYLSGSGSFLGGAMAPQYAMGGPRSGQLTLKITF
jgi:hypothetical protein